MFNFLKDKPTPTQAFEAQRKAAEQFVKALATIKDWNTSMSRFNFLHTAGEFEEPLARAHALDAVCETLKLPQLPGDVRSQFGSSTLYPEEKGRSTTRRLMDSVHGIFFLLPKPYSEEQISPSQVHHVVAALKAPTMFTPVPVIMEIPSALAYNRNALMDKLASQYKCTRQAKLSAGA